MHRERETWKKRQTRPAYKTEQPRLRYRRKARAADSNPQFTVDGQFSVTEVEQPEPLLTAESSLDRRNLSRIQEDKRSCACKMRSLNALCPRKRRRYDANLGQFLSGRRQEPVHRITRCRNHDSESPPPLPPLLVPSNKSFRPHLIRRSGALARNPR